MLESCCDLFNNTRSSEPRMNGRQEENVSCPARDDERTFIIKRSGRK